MVDFFTNTGVPLAYYLVLFTAFLVILGFIWSIIQDPKNSIKSMMGIVGVLIFVLIIYAISTGETGGVFETKKAYQEYTATHMKRIETGITSAIALIGVGLISIVGLEIANFFK